MKKVLIALLAVSVLGGAAFAAPKLASGPTTNGFIYTGGGN